MIPPVKGLLFDFGGTLDTNGTHWGIVLQEAYRKAGFVIDEKSFREMYVQGERQLAAQPVIAPEDTFDLVLQKKLALERNYGVEHGLLPDTSETDRRLALIAEMCYTLARQNTARIHPLLTNLKEKYAIALVSNFYGNLPAVLDDFGLNDCFETVVESARAGVRKPDPDIFGLALKALHLPAEACAVVGDSYKNDIAPARALGINTIWLKGRGWEPDDDNRPAGSIITDLTELASLLA